MGIWEFGQELHDKTLLGDGMIIGREQGIELGGPVYKKIQAGETDTEKIAGPLAAVLKKWNWSESSSVFG